MKSLAFLFTYNRADVLRESIASIFEQSDFIPERLVCIDDGSRDPTVLQVLQENRDMYGHRSEIEIITKAKNAGFGDSAVRALAYARRENPEYLLFLESDYIFQKHGLDVVMDCFENTTEGQLALGVVGYDHPQFYYPQIRDTVFPRGMLLQMGEDNVNRGALHRPVVKSGKRFRFGLELVSNTCWTSYLNWHRIREVAREQPEIDDLLDQACAPREHPNYPESGKYKNERSVDDGMLSHAINLTWNRWAIRHRVDRSSFAAWLNIKPSVAEHRHWGGMHS